MRKNESKNKKLIINMSKDLSGRPSSGGFALMEGPILEGTGDPETKKQHFILDEIDEHLTDLKIEQGHSIRQGCFGTIAFLCVIAGTVMIIVGLSLTAMFQQFPKNMVLFGIGCAFVSTAFCWLGYVFCPGKKIKEHRKALKAKKNVRSESQKKKEVKLDDIESTLDENAYKKGIVPFPEKEKQMYLAHDGRRGISKKYLKLGSVVAADLPPV